MPTELTPELNMAVANDDLDTADYLVLPAGLTGNLRTLDGLFSASTGHAHYGAHQGGQINPSIFPDGSFPGAKLIDGSVTTPKIADSAVTAAKIAAGVIEAVYAASWVNTAINYVVTAGVSYVFCTAAVTVTLPAANVTNRPITVVAVAGQSTVSAASGGVIGGSANLTTGAVQNGVVVAPEAFTYKSDGTNWRAV